MDQSRPEDPQELLRRATEALRAVIQERSFTRAFVESYAPDSFGNCVIVFESPEFRIRLVRDRGQIFVHVGFFSGASQWPLCHLVGFLEGETEPRAIEGLELQCEVLAAFAARIFDRNLLADRSGRLQAWAEAWAARAFASRSP